MFLQQLKHHLPNYWSPMSTNEDVKLINLNKNSREYKDILISLSQFPWPITDIYRVQNSYLYLQFLLKKEEYETQGNVVISQLYHATAKENVSGIVSENFDWRLANRVRYGKGVSFSPCPKYANNRSNKSNGKHRAMIMADVLIGDIEHVDDTCILPSEGFDTTTGDQCRTYVKYYDNEFYPKYVVYYVYKNKH